MMCYSQERSGRAGRVPINRGKNNLGMWRVAKKKKKTGNESENLRVLTTPVVRLWLEIFNRGGGGGGGEELPHKIEGDDRKEF